MTDPFKEKADRALSSLHLNDWEKHCLFTAAMEEKKMKKKFSFALAIALALVVAFGGMTIAEKYNLFDVFSNYDDRLSAVSRQSVLDSAAQITVETPELGATTITFSNAYFDGENIILGYTVANMTQAQYFTPTEEEIASMRKEPADHLNGFFSATEEQDEMDDAYIRALHLGIIRGVKGVSVLPSVSILDENGESYGGILCYEFVNREAENVTSCLQVMGPNYDPLPDPLRNADRITVEIQVYRDDFALWFDGETQYVNRQNTVLDRFTFTVEKSAAVLPESDFSPL